MKPRISIKNRNLWLMLLGDAVLILLSYYAAYYLRFEGDIGYREMTNFLRTSLWIIPLKLICFFYFGLYRGMWRYTGINDLENLAKACVTSSSVIVFLLVVTVRFVGYPRSVFVIDFLITFLLIGGFRMGIRLFYHGGYKGNAFSLYGGKDDCRRVLIIGAGDAGEKTLREVLDNPRLPFRVLGFIDDNPKKAGRAIHDVPVLGGVEDLGRYVEEYRVDDVFVAVPSATGPQMRTIVKACEGCKVRFRTVPGIGELIDGKVSIKALRDVSYQDLMGRPPTELDEEGIMAYLKDKRILVTGAGGSIGSELCRQIVRFNPESLILLDASEPSLYAVHMELKHSVTYLKHTSILGSIQSRPLIASVFRRYDPQVVFHAAAYKHVPMLEKNPWQAVFNNILGTRVVMEQSISHGVEHFVLVSTDKAVRPTNVMGASKRVDELLLQGYQGMGTRMMGVRFGNVVGSSGSVVPLFRGQIARGGPVTVTHPEVTRYFMTIPEACSLILQAGALGLGGEIFVLEMGTPVKIVDMARDLIRLSGKEPDIDVEIVFTGLRAGEKLYEELITEGEDIIATDHRKIMVLKSNGQWNGHGDQESFRSWLIEGVEILYELAERQDAAGIREKLKELVPEYEARETDSIF